MLFRSTGADPVRLCVFQVTGKLSKERIDLGDKMAPLRSHLVSSWEMLSSHVPFSWPFRYTWKKMNHHGHAREIQRRKRPKKTNRQPCSLLCRTAAGTGPTMIISIYHHYLSSPPPQSTGLRPGFNLLPDPPWTPQSRRGPWWTDGSEWPPCPKLGPVPARWNGCRCPGPAISEKSTQAL